MRERGAVLLFVTILALIAAIASYAVLILTSGEAIQAKVFDERNDARYLSEAGMVFALEQLRANPDYPECGQAVAGQLAARQCCDTGAGGAGAQPVGSAVIVWQLIDTGGASDGSPDGALTAAADTAVEIEVTNCGAGREHTVNIRTAY